MKSRYEMWLSDDGIRQLSEMRENGDGDEKIAERIGISVKRLRQWSETFRSVREALYGTDKEEQVKLAEQALLKCATGYRYFEITYQRNSDTGEMEAVKSVEKECAPNTTALFFLLRNLCPDKWSDKPEAKESNQGGIVILPLAELSDIQPQDGGETE